LGTEEDAEAETEEEAEEVMRTNRSQTSTSEGYTNKLKAKTNLYDVTANIGMP
jgi:hypothetical protein